MGISNFVGRKNQLAIAMEFEQWKLLRELEEETGLQRFYKELGSVNRLFTIFLFVGVLVSVTVAFFYFVV
jgi:hypothetical protein